MTKFDLYDNLFDMTKREYFKFIEMNNNYEVNNRNKLRINLELSNKDFPNNINISKSFKKHNLIIATLNIIPSIDKEIYNINTFKLCGDDKKHRVTISNNFFYVLYYNTKDEISVITPQIEYYISDNNKNINFIYKCRTLIPFFVPKKFILFTGYETGDVRLRFDRRVGNEIYEFVFEKKKEIENIFLNHDFMTKKKGIDDENFKNI